MKMFKRICVLAMAVIMAMSLTACESADAKLTKKVTGKYNCSAWDLSEAMVKELDESMAAENMKSLSEYTDLEFHMIIDLELMADGKGHMDVDRDAVMDGYHKMFQQIGTILPQYFEDYFTIIMAEDDMTLEDAYKATGTSDIDGLMKAALGMSLEEFWANTESQVITDDLLASMEDSLSSDLAWSVKDGQVIIDGDTFTYNEADGSLYCEMEEYGPLLFVPVQ